MRKILLLVLVLAACRPPAAPTTREAYEAPPGKRAVAVVFDKSQIQFLSPGDAVEVLVMVDTPRADATTDTHSDVLAARSTILRVKPDWSAGTGLAFLALTPEEAQYAALAAEREDRLFLSKLDGDKERLERKDLYAQPPGLEKNHRGVSVLIYPDQQEFLVPGDRVDVISTRQGYKAGGKSELTALTLLQDVLVLRSGPPEGNEEWAAVQLMVDTEQAKLLTRAAAGENHLTLAVRGPNDRAKRAVEPSKMSRKLGTEAERSSPKT
jgi:Flp pilus assembly protein CpaB